MTQNELTTIKEVAKEFFKKMGLETNIEVKGQEDLTVPINIEMEEPQVLIGEKGQSLAEAQHILKNILKRKITPEGPFYIDLDINGYKKKKAVYLKEMAGLAADEVVLVKKEKHLPPMSAYERRVVHLALASRGDVVTESIGQGPERQIVIRSCP